MDCSERRSHTRGVYPTQNTQRMGTEMVYQEEEADTSIIVIEQYEIQKKGMWARKRKVPKQDLTSIKDLTIGPNEERDSPYHAQIGLSN